MQPKMRPRMPARRARTCLMKAVSLVIAALSIALFASAAPQMVPSSGVASWYGEELRGKPMANGRRFDPDRLTAASWYYQLGTQVRVTLRSSFSSSTPAPSVLVTITDRGPAKRLVRQGRIIDLGYAAFKRLARPHQGLVEVIVQPNPSS